jgi:hypothetical protein
MSRSLSRSPFENRPMRTTSQTVTPKPRTTPAFTPTFIPEPPAEELLTLRLQIGYCLITSLSPIQKRVEVTQLSRVATPELLDHILARLDYVESHRR